MKPDPRNRYVYFIKPVGQAGPIKIGHSHIPFERLNVQMNWSPAPLEMMTWALGGRNEEMALHRKFAEQRSHCEWFWPTPEMLGGIDAIRAGSSLHQAFGLAPVGTVADWYAQAAEARASKHEAAASEQAA